MYENLLANVPTDLWIGGQWRKASDGGRFDVIDPAKDIDGVTPVNVGRLVQNRAALVACTPAGVIEMLEARFRGAS